MLCWALVEQARHEHMSDEYKNRYIINSAAVAHILGLADKHESPTVGSERTNQRGETQPGEQASQIRVVDRNYGNYHSILFVRIVY